MSHESAALSTSGFRHRPTRRDVIRYLAAPAIGGTIAAAAAPPSMGHAFSQRNVQQHARRAGSQQDLVASGLVGDGVSDDGPALQEFIERAAAENLPLTIPPGFYGIYYPVEILSGVTIHALGATLVTFIESLGENETAPTVRVHDATDVEIHGLRIDGRRDSFEHTQWKHGFSLHNSARVLIQDCAAYDCKGDGIILDDTEPGTLNEDIEIVNSMFHRNYRNAGTASGVRNVEFRDCVFSGTSGTKPMEGFDIEPDRPDVVCTDVRFIRCRFIANGEFGTDDGAGFGISLQDGATEPQENFLLRDCTISGNAGGGLDLYRVPKVVRVENCIIDDNDQWGVRVFDAASDLMLEGGQVSGNRGHGILIDPQDGGIVENISILDVTIADNVSEGSDLSDGISMLNDVSQVMISGCTIEGAPRYGVYAADTVSGVTIEETGFSDNGTADVFPETLDAG